MPPPKPRGAPQRPTTGERPRIISRTIVEAKPLPPVPSLYQKRGVYRIEPSETAEQGTWYQAINVQTGAVVRRITHTGIHFVYRTITVKRLRAMMREEMSGFIEEEND